MSTRTVRMENKWFIELQGPSFYHRMYPQLAARLAAYKCATVHVQRDSYTIPLSLAPFTNS
eukprot:1196179-Prorocentrum_minimum.AAC.3